MKHPRLSPIAASPVPPLVVVILLLSSLLTPMPAFCSETEAEGVGDLHALTLEELMEIEVPTVYGACKYDQKVTDAPASVSVITADEIRRYGYRSLADILRSVRGFTVSSDRNYQYLGVRGFSRLGDYNSRVLLLIDGHRLNNSVYDQAPIGTDFPLDVELISRVEVIRGPSSSLYGASAFFGVINVITREGKDLKAVEAAAAAGSRETYSGRLSYGTKFSSGLEVMLSGARYKSEGKDRLYFSEFDALGIDNGIAEDVDEDESYGFFSRFSFRDLTLSGLFASREKAIPTGAYETVFNDRRNRSKDVYGYLDLRYRHRLQDNGEVTASVSYDNYYYRGNYIYAGTDPADPLLVNKDSADGEWVSGELLLTRRFFEEHTVTAGIEERYNFRLEQRSYYQQPYQSLLDDRRNLNIFALYLQDQYQINQELSFVGGVRYDHYDSFGGTTNPRLALIYQPAEKTVLKLLYGKAFRAPNVYEMFYSDAISYRENPDLQPERITTTELVYDQYLGEHFRSSLSGYYYRIRGLITQQTEPDGFLMYRNSGDIEAKGVEAEVELRWSDGFQGRASYVLQRAKDLDQASALTNSPRHQGKLNLNFPLVRRKLFAAAEIQHTGSRKTLLGNYSGSFSTANLTLFSQNLLKGLELSAGIYNMFDKKYRDPVAGELRIDPNQPELGLDTVAQDGRTFRIKVTYRF